MSSSVDYWLKAAARYPLLNKRQEVMLGLQVQRMRHPDATSEEIRIGRRAMQKMINCNLRLVASNAKRYLPRIRTHPSIGLEDLFQEGVFGLTRGVELFDPTRGYAASTYFTAWIRQAIGRCIASKGNNIYLPNTVQGWILKLHYAPEDQVRTREQVQQFLDLTDRQMEALRLALLANKPSSLDVPTRSARELSDASSLGDCLADPHSQPDAAIQDLQAAIDLIEGLVSPDEMALFRAAALGKESVSELAKQRGTQPRKLRDQLTRLRQDLNELLPETAELLAA